MLCCKKQPKVARFELAFLTLCENTTTYQQQGMEHQLNHVWKEAELAHEQSQIILAGKSSGQSALHRLAQFGNATVLKWYFTKCDEYLASPQVLPPGKAAKKGKKPAEVQVLDVNKANTEGYPPLFLACQQGYKPSQVNDLEPEKVRDNRLECAKILVQRGADTNFVTKVLKMTSLHWAAQHGDFDLAKLLLKSGTRVTFNSAGDTPIDVAGQAGHKRIVELFCHKLIQLKYLPNGDVNGVMKKQTKRDRDVSPLQANQEAKSRDGHSPINDKSVSELIGNNGSKLGAQPTGFKSSLGVSSLTKMPTVKLEALAAPGLRRDAVSNKKILVCKKINAAELTPEEQVVLRGFYWAASLGLTRFIRLMILLLKWSPFIKTFRKRSVLQGAIVGNQPRVCRLIIQDYKYETGYEGKTLTPAIKKKSPWLAKADQLKIFGKDFEDNNILHHCYIHDMPEVREMLRGAQYVTPISEILVKADLFERSKTRVSNIIKAKKVRETLTSSLIKQKQIVDGARMNKRGLKPVNRRHYLKAADSDESFEAEGEQDQSRQVREETQATEDSIRDTFDFDNDGDVWGGDEAIAQETYKQMQEKTYGDIIEDFLQQKDQHEWRTGSKKYHLKDCSLSDKAKLAQFNTPDYCIVTKAETLSILLLELEPLFQQGGVFYGVYNHIQKTEDFNKDKLMKGEQVRVVLFFDDVKLDLMGEELRIETRLKLYDCQLPFRNAARTLFEQFSSRQQQFIVIETLRREIDFVTMQANGVVLDHFPMHMPVRKRITTAWQDYKWRLALGMLSARFLDNMQPLNVIKDYYGEKMGFYFAWLIHYTGWLVPPALFGLVFGLFMLFRGWAGGEEADNWLNTPMSFIYGLIMMVWVTLFNESWIRKQNQIANDWLVRNYQDQTQESDEFRYESTVDPDTQHKQKVATKSAFKIQMFVGLPISLLFVTLVVGSQVLLQYLNLQVREDKESGEVPSYYTYIPSIINVLLIGIFGRVYRMLCLRLIRKENHRFLTGVENSLINKIYMFQFVNTYISNFVYIFYYQDFGRLQRNLIIVMVFKQMLYNVIEYMMMRRNVSKKLTNVKKVFTERKASLMAIQQNDGESASFSPVERADLRMHRLVEKQLSMQPLPDTNVFYYNEAVIQMGFIAFFAVSFPFAPLFSFFTNLLEIKIKLNMFAEYGRRRVAEAASGIGNWMSIISFISFFAIPINLCILLFARNPSSRVGAFQNLEELPLDEQSAMSRYLTKRDDKFWTRANIVLLAIAVEHVIIALKVVIALVIPDVPKNVKVAERNRPQVELTARKEITKVKKSKGLQDIEEEIQEAMVKAEQEQALEGAKHTSTQLSSTGKPSLRLKSKSAVMAKSSSSKALTLAGGPKGDDAKQNCTVKMRSALRKIQQKQRAQAKIEEQERKQRKKDARAGRDRTDEQDEEPSDEDPLLTEFYIEMPVEQQQISSAPATAAMGSNQKASAPIKTQVIQVRSQSQDPSRQQPKSHSLPPINKKGKAQVAATAQQQPQVKSALNEAKPAGVAYVNPVLLEMQKIQSAVQAAKQMRQNLKKAQARNTNKIVAKEMTDVDAFESVSFGQRAKPAATKKGNKKQD